jgi:hypothetical protein
MAQETFTRAASDHGLVYGYAYARVLMGRGAGPWVVRPLAAWLSLAECELRRRRLLGTARHREASLLTEHPAHPVHGRDVRPS